MLECSFSTAKRFSFQKDIKDTSDPCCKVYVKNFNERQSLHFYKSSKNQESSRAKSKNLKMYRNKNYF